MPGAPKQTSRFGPFVDAVVAWAALILAGVGTFVAWWVLDGSSTQRARDQFLFEVAEARAHVRERVAEYEHALHGGVAMFAALGRRPTRDEWRRFTANGVVDSGYPGMKGLGVAVPVSREDLPRHLQEIRASGEYDAYAVHPEGDRPAYVATLHLEPHDVQNERLLGFDMASDPVLRVAMEHARDSGAATLSDLATIVQPRAADESRGLVLFLPVYAPGAPVETVEARRRALIAFVYAPLATERLMSRIFSESRHKLAIEVLDGEDEGAGHLFDSRQLPGQSKVQPRFSASTTVDLPGRSLRARFHSLPAFDAGAENHVAVVVVIAGLFVSVLLFYVTRTLAGERRRVLRKAEELTYAAREGSRRLALAKEATSLGLWESDLESGSLYWDARTFEIHGRRIDPARPLTVGDWESAIHPDDLERVLAGVRRAVTGDGRLQETLRILRPDGVERILEAHALVQRSPEGRATRLTGTVRDVTERTRAADRLILAATVFEHAAEGIIVTDDRERIIEVNASFSEITGYSREEVLGQTPRILKSGRSDAGFYAEMWSTLARTGRWRGEVWNRRKSGELYSEVLSIAAVPTPDGKVARYVAHFSDTTLYKENQRRLERLTHYDPLTQLPNRVLLSDRLQHAMANAVRTGKQLAVCCLDLDGFKSVNDALGHEVGDKLLVHVAERLGEHLRPHDSVARLGGDEFALLLTGFDDIASCELVLNRILRALCAAYDLGNGTPVSVSASIGLTLYPADDGDADTLLRHADQAMYQAKQTGRNRYVLFDAEHDRQARTHREVLTRIEQALEHGEFRLYYQPKVNLRTGAVVGAEALLRWLHPERGLLSPGEFLPQLENRELALRLGAWVIDEALRQLEVWGAHGLMIPVSVNVFGAHLQQPGFAIALGEQLARHPDVAPSRLELEVLETTAIEDTEWVSRVIQDCRALGVTFALDDFGTGYSSLTYLKQLPADTLKIDQSFVRELLVDPGAIAIVEGVVGLTQAFRRHVVAEGVETIDHGVFLLRLGCDLGQGFGIARPMPADALPDWVAAYRQPPEWKANASSVWLRDDLPLLGAEVEHRRWVEHLVSSLDSRTHLAAPPLEPHVCRFGHWLQSGGRVRYGHLPSYASVALLHERLHVLGKSLVEYARQGHHGEAHAGVKELYELRSNIVEGLGALHSAAAGVGTNTPKTLISSASLLDSPLAPEPVPSACDPSGARAAS